MGDSWGEQLGTVASITNSSWIKAAITTAYNSKGQLGQWVCLLIPPVVWQQLGHFFMAFLSDLCNTLHFHLILQIGHCRIDAVRYNLQVGSVPNMPV